MMQLALYRGPVGKPLDWRGLKAWGSHLAICLRTLSRHSHAELCINGTCYSASVRDHGVRSKRIDLASGRWDVYALPGADEAAALAWFARHKGQHYDWPGIVAWVLPVRQHAQRWTCFEAVGAMLGLPRPHRLHARALKAWALAQQPESAHA